MYGLNTLCNSIHFVFICIPLPLLRTFKINEEKGNDSRPQFPGEHKSNLNSWD